MNSLIDKMIRGAFASTGGAIQGLVTDNVGELPLMGFSDVMPPPRKLSRTMEAHLRFKSLPLWPRSMSSSIHIPKGADQ